MSAVFDFGLDPVAPKDGLALLRRRIADVYRVDEASAVGALIEEARLSPAFLERTQALATRLAEAVRAERSKAGGVDALMLEFSLDSREGIALMCLAEALLRIPDAATRDRLIRDKVSKGEWSTHVGASPSLFVNAAAWGLLVTGRIVETRNEGTLEQALASLLRKGGEPLIRKGVDLAMRLLGRQFVTGRTIDEALGNARERETRGYTFSFDMLGEAAMTAGDAVRYFTAYQTAIHAIGRAANGRGVVAGNGISVKLSALHPRYSRSQRDRVRKELIPRVVLLAMLARNYDIGFNIDAEEADRLDLSLDVMAALAGDAALLGWGGLGFVVQAYQKRAFRVIDWLVALARLHRRRLMVRLVKGAYWDTEIKRAQVDGMSGYPVFTRKSHTDVSYLACARRMLAAPDAIYPQFASHNAFTIAAIHTMAGDAAYEFQCLHGMGESVYDEIVGKDKLDRACRIYAPVGSHETLLAYLVRRLLENGANSSFVNRIVDPAVSIASLVADPVEQAEKTQGLPHPSIPLPIDLLPGRINSRGADLAEDLDLAALASALTIASESEDRDLMPDSGDISDASAPDQSIIRNPADHRDIVGTTIEASIDAVAQTISIALDAGSQWTAMPADLRCFCLEQAADLLEAERPAFIALAMREAGKTLSNAVSEVREAADFLRYYAAEARSSISSDAVPLGPIVAISPWNFPLAIFMGQISAALAAGNPVIAKCAEQTPLIAELAVHTLHRAGVPPPSLQLLFGRGETVGAALVADPRVAGVIFTGSTDVARLISKQLSQRDDDPVLIAETGGLNAMIVDSSALPEQVVADALTSAFDSAGQRCSALRVLCVQDDIATDLITMLEGTMRELRTGNPTRLQTDVGPVIDADARAMLLAHIDRMRAAGMRVVEMPLEPECADGTFVAPTLVDLGGISGLAQLTREVFGPVLHVLRWRRDELTRLTDAIGATGYALTHGIHTRIDETVAAIMQRVHAGNIYVNRNIIGAVVGVQPFGGHGLSGSGPKAGGPLYLQRLVRHPPLPMPKEAIALPGPTGETNSLEFHPRGVIACIASDERALFLQAKAALATGNTVLMVRDPISLRVRENLGKARVTLADKLEPAAIDALMLSVGVAKAKRIRAQFADTPGKIIPIIVPDQSGTYDWTRLVVERTVTINTAAAGGNAALLSLAEHTEP